MKLSRNILPINYRLVFEPHLVTSTFHGEALINVQVQQVTNEIILNTADLKLTAVKLKQENDTIIPTNILNSSENETTTFKFASALNGRYDLIISYEGKITNNLKGLYGTNCIDKNGKLQLAGVTQMVPTDARRCFPCWDEPNFKASFDITLIVKKGLLALSNMPVKSLEEVDSERVRYDFDRSPIMSTYLVAMIIGHYDYVEQTTEDGIAVRVYTPTGKSEQGRFALDITTKVLPYYRDYFNITYPLPKLDLIGVADLSYGAMENWGLVTYRENRLLVDPQNTSTRTKQEAALTVTHEVAHQWFGNLVTMDWWTDLWLNEGYATYLQYLSTDTLFPEYNIWTQFIQSTYSAALKLDALKNSHPIEVPIQNPGEVFEIFDVISYNKGASVIRMLIDYIGDETFRKGMHLYLKKFQYKNAATDDLWSALQEASDKPVNEVMSTWTRQMGYPLITVTRKDSEHPKGVILTVSQSKFNTDGSTSEGYHWMVPISVCTGSNPTQKVQNFLLKTASTEILLPDIKPTWIKLNSGTIGFYRTKYSDEMLQQFLPDIKNKRIPPTDRLGLLDDLFALAKSGHISTVNLLKFLTAFENETDYNVWSSIITILDSLARVLEYTPHLHHFYQYQKKLLANIKEQISWEPKSNESYEEGLLRTLILDHLTSVGEEKFEKEAFNRFQQHVNKQMLLSADYRLICYKVAIRNHGRNGYNKLLDCYKSTDLVEEKNRIISVFGCTNDLELATDVLEFYMSDHVRLGDKILGIVSLSHTKLGRELTWKYMKENWDQVSTLFGSAGSLLPKLIKQSLENFSSVEMAAEIKTFFDKKEFGIERSLQQALENIQMNVSWLRRDAESVGKYLSNF